MATAERDGESGAGAAGGRSGQRFGSIRIGNVRGGVVGIGDNNHIVNGPQEGAVCDPAYEELLRAVQQLSADLERLVATPQVSALSDELAGAQDEIQRTGRAGAGRLARLRVLLQDAGAGIGMLASGVAVGQAVGALLGG